MKAPNSIGANARTIAVVTIFARVAGFIRTLVFAGTVGATLVGEAYQSMNTVPNVLFEVAAGGVLAAATVPLLAGALGRGDRAGADEIASALLTWVLAITIPLAALIAVARRPIAAALLGESSSGALHQGTRMLAVFAPQVILYGVGLVLSGVLQSHQRFLAVALAPLLSSLVVIATYAAYGLMTAGTGPRGDGPLWVLAGGTTLGVAALALPLLGPVHAVGVRLRPRWRFPAGVARRVGTLAGAGLIVLAAQQLTVLITVWLANHRAPVATITVYYYVQAIYLLPYAVLAVPVATAAFPVLAAAQGAVAAGSAAAARGAGNAIAAPGAGNTAAAPGAGITAAAQGAGNAADATLARAARAIVALAGLATGALVVAAADLGGFFAAFDRGQSGGGAGALADLPIAVASYAPGLVGLGVIGLFTRALYLRGRPVLAAAAAAGGWLVAGAVPLLVLAGAADSSRQTLMVLGLGSSVGMSLAAVLLLGLVRGSWGANAVRGVPRAMAAVAVGVSAAWVLNDVVGQRVWPTPESGLAVSVGHGLLVGGLGAAVVAAALVAFGAVPRAAVGPWNRRGTSADGGSAA